MTTEDVRAQALETAEEARVWLETHPNTHSARKKDVRALLETVEALTAELTEKTQQSRRETAQKMLAAANNAEVLKQIAALMDREAEGAPQGVLYVTDADVASALDYVVARTKKIRELLTKAKY